MVKVTLSDQVEYSISEPKGKHLRQLPDILELNDNPTTVAFKLITLLATPKLTLDDIDEMAGEDALRLVEAIKGFRLDGSSSQ